MKRYNKGMSCVLIAAILFSSISTFFWWEENDAKASVLGNASVQPTREAKPTGNSRDPYAPNEKSTKRYAVGFSYIDIWSNSLGTWSTHSPNESGVEIKNPYTFSFPGRVVKDVQVRMFNPDNPIHQYYFEKSRIGDQSFNNYRGVIGTNASSPSKENVIGQGTSTVKLDVKLTGTLRSVSGIPYDLRKRNGDCGTCGNLVEGYRYFFPVLFEFELDAKIEIGHWTTNGQSLNSVFGNSVNEMVRGQSYPSAPPTNANYKYVGHKKTDSGDYNVLQAQPLTPGSAQTFTYSGQMEKYLVNYYYEAAVPNQFTATIKHRTRDGKVIPEMPDPPPSALVQGQSYSFTRQSHPDYTYYGHSKNSTNVEPAVNDSNFVPGADPPRFTFNGNHHYRATFFYDRKPPGPGSGQGKVIVHHMVRTSPSSGSVLVEEETFFVATLPGTRQVQAKLTHGSLRGGNYSYKEHNKNAFTPNASNFPIALSAPSNQTAYVTFFYDKEDTGPPGLSVDFEIEKPMMYFGDSNKVTPVIGVSGAGCRYQHHYWTFSQGTITKTYGPEPGMRQPFYLTPPYDGMGLGTIVVTLEASNTCGQSGKVTKTVQVISDPTNRPPIFNIGWFKQGNLYGWEPDASIVLRGERVNLRVIVNPLPRELGGGTPYDPDGDDISYYWNFGESPSEWIKGLPGEYGLDPNQMGFTNLLTTEIGSHTITAMAVDSRGASATRTAVLNVVSPEPTPLITVPARVVQNRPIPENGINGDLSFAAPGRTVRDYHWTNKRDSYPNVGVEQVELEVTDNHGVRNLPEMKAIKHINVMPDLPPVAQLELPERAFREGFEMTNSSHSPDGDEIIRATLRYRYDANNDGSFTNETALPFVLPVGETRIFKPLKVGKYRFDIEVEEDWGLKHSTTYYLEVVNEAPEVGFSLKGENPEPPQFDITNESTLLMVLGDSWEGSTLSSPNLDLFKNLNLTYNTFRQSFTAGVGRNPFIAPSVDAVVRVNTVREEGNKYFNPNPAYLREGRFGTENPPFIVGTAPYQEIYGQRGASGMVPRAGAYWRDVTLASEQDSGRRPYLAHDIKGGSYAYRCITGSWTSDNYGDSEYYYNCEVTRTDQFGEVSWTHKSLTDKFVGTTRENPYTVRRHQNGSEPVLISEDGLQIGFSERWDPRPGYSNSIKWFDIETLEPVPADRVIRPWVQPTMSVPYTQINLLFEDEDVKIRSFHKSVQPPDAWMYSSYYTALDYHLSFVNKQTGEEKQYPIYTNRQSYTSYSGNNCSPWDGGSTRSEYDNTSVLYAVSNDGVVYAVESLNKIHVLDKYGTKLQEIPTLNKTPRSINNCNSGYTTEKSYGIRDVGFESDGKLVVSFVENNYIWRPDIHPINGLRWDTTGAYSDTITFTIQKSMPPRPYGSNEIGQVLKKDTRLKNADFTFDVRQTMVNPSASNPSGLNFRAQDHRNMYRLEISDKLMAVSKIENGQRTQLGSAAITLNSEEFSTVKVSARGNKIRVRYKGMPVFEVTDSTFDEGTYGFFMNAYGSNFRNLIVGVPLETGNELDNVGLVGEKLNYTTTFDDLEKDERIEGEDQWTYLHTDPDKFLDSGDGLSGMSRHHEKTYASPRESLDRVGVYSISYSAKDDPTPEGYEHPDPTFAEYVQQADEYTQFVTIHRRPIAKFTVRQAADYLVTYTDTSYDPDRYLPDGRCSTEDTGINYCQTRGITSYTYEYIDPKGEKFDGQLRRPSYAGLYTLRLSVRDEYGAWSDWYEQELFLDADPPNTPPVPGFTQSHTNTFRGVELTFESTAYDAEDGPRENLKHWYYIQNDQTGAVEVLSSNSRTTWTKTFSTLGRFYVRQVVEDSGGLRATHQRTVNIVNAPPTTNITNPSSTNQNSPTILTELRPNFTWNYHDVDDDPQTRYQLRVSRYGGLVQQITNEISSSAKNHVATGDLPERVDMYVEVRAHDGNVWGEWSSPKFFRIITNRPPTADFDWSPKPVYEGDRLQLIDRSSDPDGDPLTHQWQIRRPNGSSSSSTLPRPELTGVAPGEYRVTLTVSDGKESASTSKVITVLPLDIAAEIHHTPLWLERHREAGHETESAPKDFYAGETLVLRATTSAAPVRSVTAVLDSRGMDGGRLLTSVPLSPSVHPRYAAEMYDERWGSLASGLTKGPHRVRFTVEYANGVVKTADVPFTIIGNALEAAGVHRRH
ncbi:PKD domain-containing protein [Paenibacillus sp. 1P07SE]|uniref:PKD domain-containing protein n=1 Tax=Paenibacillus sp. 1P07SE TaxID=3132209 RepID=UPI0039A4453D